MSQTLRCIAEPLRLPALLAVIVLGLLTIVGSGGGGGGGDGGAGPSPLVYTGITTQARIDQNNAQTLVALALQGGSAGTLVTAAVGPSTTSANSGKPRVIGLARVLKGGVERIDFAAGRTTVAGALQPYSETIPSPYGGGNLVISFTVDDQTGTFNGTATYNNYCEDADSCINGESGFAGQLDLFSLEPLWEQFTFTLLSVTDNGDSYQMSGTIGINAFSPTPMQTQVTLSIVIADGSGTYKVENYVYVIANDPYYVEVAQPSGRFYHPTYGYVEVRTLAPLRYRVANTLTGAVTASWPYLGELEIAGASDSKARLTALNDGANAPLMPRMSGQLVYDADRNVTWLADANLAASNSFGVADLGFGGSMTWATAQSWIEAMNAANYLGINNWRLPTTLQPDASCSEQFTLPESYSQGYNCTGSEMGHLFYQELSGVLGQPVSAAGLFKNVMSGPYWSGTELSFNPFTAWHFNFGSGNQSSSSKDSSYYAWAVRTGDFAATPQWKIEVDWDGAEGWDTTLSGDWVAL